MADLTGSQFRMVTNMKAAPNSQGTLFQGGNARRWPRGYTPERQRQVAGNLHPDTYAALKNSPETRAIVDTVKRSTVPVEAIRNVRFTPSGPPGTKRGLGSGLRVGGMYRGATDRYGTLIGNVEVAQGEESTSTPIHELGHHQSRLLGRQSAQYNTVARRGADEGFAEAHAETHWRDQRGRPDPNFSTNPLKWSNNMSDNSRATFAKHFNKEREGLPSRQREIRASAAYQARGAQPSLLSDMDEFRMRIAAQTDSMIRHARG